MTSNRSVGRTAGYGGCDGAAGSDGEDGFRESYTAEAPADKRLILDALSPADVIFEALGDEAAHVDFETEPTAGSSR